MATYNSLDSLKAALIDKLVAATDNMAKMVEDEVDDAVMHYYQSYAPRLYDRTGTLSHAPCKSPAAKTGDGASADVYMDTSLSYNTGTWSIENVIMSAEKLTHGGWRGGQGVSIWREPINQAQSKSSELWRKALTDAGLDVK